jgi:membrane protein insertase Oxa1/YidC/SpoIIIJ
VLRNFFKTTGSVFLGIFGVLVILLIFVFSLAYADGSQGAGWMVLFFVVGVIPILLIVGLVVSMIVGLISSFSSRNQTELSNGESRPNTKRIMVYTFLIVFALFTAWLALGDSVLLLIS